MIQRSTENNRVFARMVRSKCRSDDTITRREGMLSSSSRRQSGDTPLKSGFTRGKLKRLFPKPLCARPKGHALSPINESTCTDHGSVSSTGPWMNRMLESNGTESTIHYSTEDGSISQVGVSSLLLDCDETDSADISSDTSSSSLPSPEQFRREKVYEEIVAFPSEEMLDLNVKNSTLLDVSDAEDIHMQQPPNLSSIIDSSQMNDGKDQEKSRLALPIRSTYSDKLFNAYVSVESTPLAGGVTVPSVPKKTQRPETIRPRKIKCRKRVKFSDSVTTEKMVVNNVEPVSDHTVSERIRDTVDNRETAAPEVVPQVLKRPTHHSPEQAKFFDFADKKERDTFFQKLRQRYSSVRSIFANVGGRSTDTFEDEGNVCSKI
ncbi:uncharacterized protein LOC120056869 [Salvelinus namaycush]|uniref:Uncharacterized protein LOC120056869 n=1 Tax=Salvelinus namaycush TaxID=8040 RepID=A0A8U1BP68_SALNM|nr:uncharacterized protein LOC120056869 [Salvelinus namaycush]